MKIYIVGIGPGNDSDMTKRAEQAIKKSEVISGYQYYVELIEHLTDGKEIITTAMKGEVERCQKAIEAALNGKIVSVVSSGDAGVYGMASIIFELAEPYPELEIEVIPGVTAACSGGSVLGAPLAHDFAVISLSDLLTDWSVIENRIRCGVRGDFAMSIYNPSSIKRSDYLNRACKIIMEETDKNLACGIVKNIGREGETHEVMTLQQLAETQTDMFTTVFIGNSQTKIIEDRLVTPRGYII